MVHDTGSRNQATIICIGKAYAYRTVVFSLSNDRCCLGVTGCIFVASACINFCYCHFRSCRKVFYQCCFLSCLIKFDCNHITVNIFIVSCSLYLEDKQCILERSIISGQVFYDLQIAVPLCLLSAAAGLTAYAPVLRRLRGGELLWYTAVILLAITYILFTILPPSGALFTEPGDVSAMAPIPF
mgnify:CR=1 FL=1